MNNNNYPFICASISMKYATEPEVVMLIEVVLFYLSARLGTQSDIILSSDVRRAYIQDLA